MMLERRRKKSKEIKRKYLISPIDMVYSDGLNKLPDLHKNSTNTNYFLFLNKPYFNKVI